MVGRGEFRGIFPYLVSPLEADGSVRETVLRELVRALISHGVHGLTPLGTTGEVAYLTLDQRFGIVRSVVKEARDRVPVVPAIAASSTYDAVKQAREFVDARADGLVLMLQNAGALGTDAVESYFREVAESVDCPVVLYSNPGALGSGLNVESIVRLARVPNIGYVKDASGNTGRILSILNGAGDQIRVFSASAHVPVLVFFLGGVGWMAGPACIVPKQSVRLYELAMDAKWDEALALQRRLWRINELFLKYPMAACMKAALKLQGFDVGAPVPPQQALPEPAVEEVRQALDELGAFG